MTRRIPDGLWCDVAYDAQGRLCFVYSIAGAVICERDGAGLWRVPVQTDFLRYLRIVVEGDRVYAAGQSAQDHAILVGADGAHDLGPGVDQNPVAFGRVGNDLAIWIIYAEGVRYRVVRVRDAVVLSEGSAPNTSQGIRDIAANGSIVWGDPTYGSTFAGHQFNQYQQTPDYLVGQRSDPDGIGCLVNGQFWTALQTNGAPLGVHGAFHNGTLAVCAYKDGAWIGTFAPPYPVDAPPVQPPPVHPPITPEEQPSVSFANHLDIVQRERAKYPQPSLNDEQCFRVTNAVASDPAVKADGWGLTKAPAGGSGFVVNGQNYRLDKLCHPSGYINDILSDTPGAAGAQWGPNADSNGNPSNWAPAVPILGTPAPDPGTPSQPPASQPPPSVDLQPLKDQIAALEARLSALEQKPAADDWHGGTVDVTVTGSVSITDALYGRKVTWSGKGVIK